jgi:hypothetical protein
MAVRHENPFYRGASRKVTPGEARSAAFLHVNGNGYVQGGSRNQEAHGI